MKNKTKNEKENNNNKNKQTNKQTNKTKQNKNTPNFEVESVNNWKSIPASIWWRCTLSILSMFQNDTFFRTVCTQCQSETSCVSEWQCGIFRTARSTCVLYTGPNDWQWTKWHWTKWIWTNWCHHHSAYMHCISVGLYIFYGCRSIFRRVMIAPKGFIPKGFIFLSRMVI